VLHAALAPGSYLAISHATAEAAGTYRARAEAAAATYEKVKASAPALVRTEKQIRDLFGPWELGPPGLTPARYWPKKHPIQGITIAGGLARHQ
jgi:hypothetical protein